jgi:hypothetical protein
MILIPLSFVNLVSFSVVGKMLWRGTVLTALVAVGISSGIGTALIVMMTVLLHIRESLLQFAMTLLVPLFVLAFLIPLGTLYVLSTLREEQRFSSVS